MHLQVRSQGQPVLMTSYLALEDPEVMRGPMAPRLMFGITIYGWLRGFRFLLGGRVFGFIDDISLNVLIQDRFICSIRCCALLPFSEYHILGAGKCSGQWIIYDVLLS